MEKQKRRWGDRPEARQIRPKELDSMHVMFPHMLPNRTHNEAVMHETIDMTNIEKYLAEKNKDNPEFKYTFFHILTAAMAKTVVLRPKLNRFYQANRLYERYDVTVSFVIKKKFVDSSTEGLAIIKFDSDVSPLEEMYEKTKKIVYSVRVEGKEDDTTDIMNKLKNLPRWMLATFFWFIKRLDYHGWYPKEFTKDDPYFSTLFVTNLGSIKTNADYHHLADWGTNSFFACINRKHDAPFYDENGNVTLRPVIDLGITVDERIADGLYFANSLKILRKLCENPELLELPANTPVEID